MLALLTIITHHWYDIRDLSNLSGAILDRISDADARSWVVYVVSGLLGAVGILSFIGGAAIINIWVERRAAGRMQARLGPDTVGPLGLHPAVAALMQMMPEAVLD